MATSQAGFFPVETYRDSSVTNGGTTVQSIMRSIVEARTVTTAKNLTDTTTKALTTADTKNLTNLTTRALTDTQMADIGGSISFVLKNTLRTPVPIPQKLPLNPNTT